jgi:nickel transport system ATP-binding protein
MELSKESAAKKTGELSGGQQKRIGIARALAASPRYIVFDESISGLDVILRKNILELLKRIQEEEQCSYLFITHEIDAALYLADEIHVMQNGKLIESRRWCGNLDVFKNPYTKQLLQASHLI